jgi:hypothetical protein
LQPSTVFLFHLGLFTTHPFLVGTTRPSFFLFAHTIQPSPSSCGYYTTLALSCGYYVTLAFFLLVDTMQPSFSSCGYYATLPFFLWVLRNPLSLFLWVSRNLYILSWGLLCNPYFFLLWTLCNSFLPSPPFSCGTTQPSQEYHAIRIPLSGLFSTQPLSCHLRTMFPYSLRPFMWSFIMYS